MRQRWKHKPHRVQKMIQKNIITKEEQKHRHRENKLMVTKGERGEG